MNNQSSINLLIMALKESKFQYLLPNLLAGCISGTINLIYSVSYAALIFPGELSDYLSLGLSCALISAILTALIVALQSSLPFTLSGPDSSVAVILALMVASISKYLNQTEAKASLLPTLTYVIIFSTLITGLWLFLLGRWRLGRFIRFIPYPVVGGFLAGIGWLFIQGSLKVMTGIPFNFTELDKFLRDDFMLLWFPGVVLGLSLQFLLSHYKQFWLMPSILLGATALCYLFLAIANIPLNLARIEGILFEPFNSNSIWNGQVFLELGKVNWLALRLQIPSLMALLGVVPITILLNATGLELATERDVDLDRELKTAGIANLVTGSFGGMVGHLSISRTLLNYRAGGRNRLSGIVAAIVCLFFFFFGTSSLQFFPRFVFGGLLFYLGLSLLLEWVYQGYFKLSHLDYALVILILIIVANFGFLEGVGVGLIVACLLFVITSSNLQVIKNNLSGLTYQSKFERSFHEQKLLLKEGEKIYILRLQGYLFFGTANSLVEHIRQKLSNNNLSPIKFLVLDLKWVEGIDSSAIVSFIKMKQLAQKLAIKLILTNLSPFVEEQLQFHNIIDHETAEATCYNFSDLDRGVEWCENQILQSAIFRRRRFVPLAIQLEEIFPIPEQANKLLNYLEHLKIEPGYFLFRQGEISQAIYLIESGQVSLLRKIDDEHTERLGTVGEGTIIGEIGFYGHLPHTGSAVTDCPTRLYRLSQETLNKMEQENPILAAACHQFIAQILARKIAQLTQRSDVLLK